MKQKPGALATLSFIGFGFFMFRFATPPTLRYFLALLPQSSFFCHRSGVQSPEKTRFCRSHAGRRGFFPVLDEKWLIPDISPTPWNAIGLCFVVLGLVLHSLSVSLKKFLTHEGYERFVSKLYIGCDNPNTHKEMFTCLNSFARMAPWPVSLSVWPHFFS